MKQFLFILFLGFSHLLSGQVDSSYSPVPYSELSLAMQADTCRNPQVILAPVIHYTEGVKVFLQFSQSVESFQLQEQETKKEYSFLALSDNKLVENLEVDKASYYATPTC